jgi:hypothetical protein
VRRLLTVAALPVILAAALVGVTGGQRAMAAPLAGQGCILGIICLPGSPSPTPTPSPSSPSPTAGTPSASSPSPTSPGQTTASPGSSAPASAAPSADAGQSSTASPSPSASAKATQRHAAATPGLVAAAATSVLTAQTANITGFHYVGDVDVPVAGGTQAMMKFTADTIDLSGDVTVTVIQDGTTVTTVSASQDFSDGVTLYATKLSGSLLGVPLTFTPTTISASLLTLPNAGLLQLANLVTGAIPLTMTGVTTDQLLISGGTQVTTQLSMS